MAQRINLRRAVEVLAEQGYEVAWDDNMDMEAFFSYFDHHYRPLIEEEREDWSKRSDAMRFFGDDILSIFAN